MKKGRPKWKGVLLPLAAVSVLVLVVVLILVIVLVLVVVLILVVVLVLVSVLVIHRSFPPNVFCGLAAYIGCPGFQDLSLALKIRLAKSPAKMAAVIPPAAAFRPPVKMPRNPSS